ncbi:Peptidyl-tRNA_hydrolase_PTH2 [Leishmania braziliensis MHOM/BR/75/M2904]|nr:Peptidyl-tRNA_hydrolase_PTH2 [Leishmania braziliensis MHOM/BR/75/M2904]
MAFLCVTFLQRLTSHRSVSNEAVLTSVLSRRDRAAKVLEELHVQSTSTAAAVATDQARAMDVAAADEDSWEWITSSTSDENSDSVDVDSEYEHMEALRLKMVFVVRSEVELNITAQEVVVFTASAGIQLVELLQQETNLSAAPSTSASLSVGVAGLQDHQRWRHWYLWWNRIGCGKVTLKCPNKDTMERIIATAQKHRLPMVQVRHSEIAVPGAAQTTTVPKTSDVVVVALGPAPSDVLEPITGSLKLYS